MQFLSPTRFSQLTLTEKLVWVESCRVNSGRIPLWEQHKARLSESLAPYNTDGRFSWTELQHYVYSLIPHLVNTLGKLRILVAYKGNQWLVSAELHHIDEEVVSSHLMGSFMVPLVSDKGKTRAKLEMIQVYRTQNHIHQPDDFVLLDADGFVKDTSWANVFYLVGSHIYTPKKDDVYVAGVMRTLLFSLLPQRIIEKRVTMADLIQADAIFTSNAVRGIIPVQSIFQHTKLMEPVLSLRNQIHALIF